MSPIRRPRLRHPLVIGLLLAALATASAGGYGWVRVHLGDSLWSIARHHHTTVAELVALNHLPGNGELIYAGSRLRVPLHHHRHHHHHGESHHRHRHHARHHHAASRQHWIVTHYTVRPGDSLYAICQRFHVSPDRIARANDLPSNLVVRIGQRLRIGHWAAGAGHHHRSHRHHHRAHHHHARRHHLHRHHRHHRSSTPAWVRHTRARLAVASVPDRAAVGRMIAAKARRFGIDQRFAMAIAWQESGFNQRVVSPIGAIGAMQVVPATGRFVSTYIVHRPLNLLKASDNITAGAGLLWALLTNTHRNERMAAAGYYQGLASVRAHGMFRDTKQYVADVLALRQRF